MNQDLPGAPDIRVILVRSSYDVYPESRYGTIHHVGVPAAHLGRSGGRSHRGAVRE